MFWLNDEQASDVVFCLRRVADQDKATGQKMESDGLGRFARPYFQQSERIASIVEELTAD